MAIIIIIIIVCSCVDARDETIAASSSLSAAVERMFNVLLEFNHLVTGEQYRRHTVIGHMPTNQLRDDRRNFTTIRATNNQAIARHNNRATTQPGTEEMGAKEEYERGRLFYLNKSLWPTSSTRGDDIVLLPLGYSTITRSNSRRRRATISHTRTIGLLLGQSRQ